ncbi:MAG TPA: hypothetical protein VJV79_22235 [Polyangiaceae bacterium]|nr:hypothetical protein [Polyangiaceae bacterium]
MNEPTRLLSTPESELERALLDAGRSYTASGSMRTKTLVALGLTGVGASVVPAAAAAGSPLTKAALSKVAVAMLVIGAIAVPVWRYLDRNPSSTPHEHPPIGKGSAALPAPSTAALPIPLEALPVEPAELPPSSAAASASASASTARAPARPVSAPPLTAELAALDAARTSLSHSDPAGALLALDGYSRNFPRGRLKLEAEVLRIGALAKSGQTEAARKRAETFLRLHPDSVLASRVRSYAGL